MTPPRSIATPLAICALLLAHSLHAGGKMMLFGGQGHKTYLGCLSCAKFESDSIQNRFGQHGNRFSSESILNRFSEFGSRYSNFSACNPFAQDPPAIVDADGQFYGRLTMNQHHAQRTRDRELLAWLSGVCVG